MQLSSPAKTPSPKTAGKIAASLLAATCSLLGSAPGPAIAEEESKRWEFDTALLYYGETDRVTDASAHILAQRSLLDGGLLRFKLTVDSLSGASPNGAIRTDQAQTFTSPSGDETYTTPAGETPLDSTFLDTRVALAANWQKPINRLTSIDLGASFSREYDYTHAGINARLARDFNDRRTTFSIGLGLASDSISPVGGVPLPLMPMGATRDEKDDDDHEDGFGGSESKTVADLLIGVTQVFGRRTLGQLNYSFSHSSGYLTDPYKILTVLDPETGEPVPGPGMLNTYLYENRPSSRSRHSLFGALKHHLGRDIVDLSYRFMTDDWGIDSHTLDLRYRWRAGPSWYLQPHLRYYTQGAADFYALYLVDDLPPPTYATADYRLAEFSATTFGAKVGFAIDGDTEWSVRAEYYTQSGTSPPAAGPNLPTGDDLIPTVDALILQIGYRF